MDEMRCGYYDIEKPICGLGEHTYGRAKNQTVNFQCYGDVTAESKKNPVYPAKFYFYDGQKPADRIKVNLDLACYIAANGLEGWKGRKDYKKKPKDFDRETGLMDSAGLLYAVGGVCHQMANSIFTSETKTHLSGYVSPPSFPFTQLYYGIRGNHKWAWELPDRLSFLLNNYPKTVAEHVDEIVDDITQMQSLPSDRKAFADDLIRNSKLLYGDDFLLLGKETEFVAVVYSLRQFKCDVTRQLLLGELSTSGFADEVNAEAVRFSLKVSEFVSEDLSNVFRNVRGAAIDKKLMLSANIYRYFGDRANLK